MKTSVVRGVLVPCSKAVRYHDLMRTAPLGTKGKEKPGLHEPARSPMGALHTLILECFTGEEFCRWLRHGPDGDIVPELPTGSTADAIIIDSALMAFSRRGRIDTSFFDRLKEARPHRTDEIAVIASLWEGAGPRMGRAVGAPTPSTLRRSRRTAVVQIGVALVAVLAIYLWATTGNFSQTANIQAPIGSEPEGVTTTAGEVPLLYPSPEEPLIHTSDECGAEETCGHCNCSPPRACTHNRCTTDIVGLTSCAEEATQKMLKRLLSKCAGASLERCPPHQLSKYLLEENTIDLMMDSFPARVAILLPSGNVLTSEQRAHIWLQIQALSPAFSLSHAIIFMASMKAGEDRVAGMGATQGVKNLFSILKQNDPALVQKAAVAIMGNHFTLDPLFFREKYSGSFIAWSAEAEARISKLMRDYPQISRTDYRFLLGALNQNVLVFPIPCAI